MAQPFARWAGKPATEYTNWSDAGQNGAKPVRPNRSFGGANNNETPARFLAGVSASQRARHTPPPKCIRLACHEALHQPDNESLIGHAGCFSLGLE